MKAICKSFGIAVKKMRKKNSQWEFLENLSSNGTSNLFCPNASTLITKWPFVLSAIIKIRSCKNLFNARKEPKGQIFPGGPYFCKDFFSASLYLRCSVIHHTALTKAQWLVFWSSNVIKHTEKIVLLITFEFAVKLTKVINLTMCPKILHAIGDN